MPGLPRAGIVPGKGHYFPHWLVFTITMFVGKVCFSNAVKSLGMPGREGT